MKIIETLQQDIARLENLHCYYLAMYEKSKGENLFIYVVNECRAIAYGERIFFDGEMSTLGGKPEVIGFDKNPRIGSYAEASVLTRKVADEIHAKGNFKNSKGEKVKPIGIRQAETFFSEQADNILEVIGIIEKSLEAIKQKQS